MSKIKEYGLRFLVCIKKALPRSGKLCAWLLKIILPISLVVRLLQYWGIIDLFSEYLTPIFQFIGLPGESAIVFITSCMLPLYAPIAIMTSIAFTLREATILAIMCLISHNLPVECSITKKTGSGFWNMFFLRIGFSFLSALLLNWVLPNYDQPFGTVTTLTSYSSIVEVLQAWIMSSFKLICTILIVVSLLMIIQRVLIDFNLMDKIAQPLTPVMRFFGLSDTSSFSWIVGYIVGLAYGGAVMVDLCEEGKISKSDSQLVNCHLSISHSMLEDTFLFVAIGISFWWIMGTRLLLAFIAVWGERIVRKLKTNP